MNRRNWIVVGLLVLMFGAYGGYTWLEEQKSALPEGIVAGNGRIEAEQIDISAKAPGRTKKVLFSEGDMVKAGAILVEMDVAELQASLRQAEAEVALARQTKAEAEALVIQRESELRLAEHSQARGKQLLSKGHIPLSVFEERETLRQVAAAVLGAARAQVATAASQIDASQAQVERIQTQIDDSSLTAPAAGRVLYRLAEPGEVVAAGEPVLTLLSLEKVYMEVFLQASDAGLLPIGADARIVLDALPEYSIPANVTFVSPEAQFTPKQVETLSEREKLMFRVRVTVPQDLVEDRIDHVKTGVRGMAYLRLSDTVDWPERFQRRIPADLFEK